MRRSCANHYRRMLPSLLSVLKFRSNNAVWRPVLAALDWIRSKVDGGCRFVPLQDVPIDEVIPARWRRSVIYDAGRVNRIRDRKSVGWGQGWSVRVKYGCGRIIKKK